MLVLKREEHTCSAEGKAVRVNLNLQVANVRGAVINQIDAHSSWVGPWQAGHSCACMQPSTATDHKAPQSYSISG